MIARQRLRKRWERARYLGTGALAEATWTAVLGDERNLLPLCRRHHHRVTHGFDLVPWHKLPLIGEFATEYELVTELDRERRRFTSAR